MMGYGPLVASFKLHANNLSYAIEINKTTEQHCRPPPAMGEGQGKLLSCHQGPTPATLMHKMWSAFWTIARSHIPAHYAAKPGLKSGDGQKKGMVIVIWHCWILMIRSQGCLGVCTC